MCFKEVIHINVKETLRAAASYSDSSQSRAVGTDKSVLGYSKQNLSNKLNSGRLSLNEFLKAMEEFGVELVIKDVLNNESITTQLKDASADWKIRAQEFFDLLDFLKIDYDLIQPDGNFNVEKYIEGEGERIRYFNTGSKKWYDTKCSHAISNSFYEDGEHRYGENGEATELYRTKDGEYFIAKYYESKDIKDTIEVIFEKDVADYIAKHGSVKRKPQ